MENKSKHTPGPWGWADSKDDGATIPIVDYSNDSIRHPQGPHIIANINTCDFHHKGEGNSNINLIAAAPELLEALENMEKVFYNAGRCYSKEEIDAIKLAYSAIHKAKGESK